jgi:hypothetical protein
VPELLRIKGQLSLLQGGDRSLFDADGLLSKSIEMARKQAALFWELRSAVSIARLKIQQRRPHEARTILASTCEAFAAEIEFSDLGIALLK